MKNLFLIICVSILTTIAIAAPTEKQALLDWKALEKANKTLNSKIGLVVPGYSADIIESDNDKALAAIADFEKNDLPGIQKLLKRCNTEYGKSPEKINKKIEEIVEIEYGVYKHPDIQFGQLYNTVNVWINNIAQAKKDKADALINEANAIQIKMDSYASQQTQENQDKIKELLQLAYKFDPSGIAKEILNESEKKFKK